jgi:archaellum component FlaC
MTIDELKEHLDRLIFGLHNEVSAFRVEVNRRFDAVDRRFEAMDNRLDRLGNSVAYVESQMAAFTRWAERLDKQQTTSLDTQRGQQHAVDQLARRITKIEEKLGMTGETEQ